MAQGTAWIFTGWTVVGGSLVLFGFLFFYEVPDIRTTPSPIINTSVLMTTPTAATQAETTTASAFDICGVRSDAPLQRSFKGPVLGSWVAAITSGRIIGGSTAVEGDWPWIAYIYELGNGPVNGAVCGGSLLNSRWVVSAAHCFATPKPELYAVTLGEHTVGLVTGREVVRNITELLFRQYDPVSFNNDIALVKMSSPISYNEYIRPLCLVPANTRTDAIESPTFAGSFCTVLGWGFTSSPGGSRSDTLMQLNVNILPKNLCQIFTLTNAGNYSNRIVAEGDPKFCAGGIAGEDSCNGDSGGPLLCLHKDGKYFLHGIVSYGTNTCAQKDRPGIYTKVADFANWIANNTS